MQAREQLSRLPNPQLLLDYLDLYPKYREEDRNSVTNRAKYGLEYVASYVTYKPPVDDELTKLVTIIKSEINKCVGKEAIEWYKLSTALRGELYAQAAQHLKRKEGNSTLYETCHALASLILNELKECKFLQTSEDSAYSNFIYKKRHDLIEKLKVTRATKQNYIQDKKSNDVDEMTETENEILKELSELGDIPSFVEAEARKLFPEYKRPSVDDQTALKCHGIANPCAPLELQEDFFEWFFKGKFQPIAGVSITEFRANAWRRVNQTLNSTLSEKERELDLVKERLKMESEAMKLQEELKKKEDELKNITDSGITASTDTNTGLTKQTSLLQELGQFAVKSESPANSLTVEEEVKAGPTNGM